MPALGDAVHALFAQTQILGGQMMRLFGVALGIGADGFGEAIEPNASTFAINHYPPRGDNKEGWDNIDIFGWLNYKMQLKINFLCRDSILAAPIVLDVALFLDLAKRAGMDGIQEWLSFYFKSPMVLPELYPEHDLFIQLIKLKNTLRAIKGEDLITHLGLDYYE